MDKAVHRKIPGGFCAPASDRSPEQEVPALAASYARWRRSLRPSTSELWLWRMVVIGIIAYPVLGVLDAVTSFLVQAAGVASGVRVYETNWLIAPLISLDGGFVGLGAFSAKALISAVPVVGLFLLPRWIGRRELRGRATVAAGLSLVFAMAIANAGFVALYNWLLYLNVRGDPSLTFLVVAFAGFPWLMGFGFVVGCVLLAVVVALDGRR